MRIDGLHPDKRRPGSIRVLVGGKPAWTVPADVIAALDLKVGSSVGAATSEQLDQAADVEGALRSALKMLERRSHSRFELARKLRFKGHSSAAGSSALERLDAMGLLDDAAFASAYAAARAGRGRGPARLRRDLEALGVGPEAVAAAIASLDTGESGDPWQRAVEQATRRAAGMAGLKRETRHRRLSSFFARRGFNGEQVREMVDRLAKGSGSQPDW